MRAKHRIRELLVFAAVGLTATGIQYGILLIGVREAGLAPTVSSGIGFVTSAVANYWLNYRLTFRSTKSHWSAASRFVAVATVGLMINLGLMQLLTAHVRLQYIVAQVIATVVVFAWNFCGSAFWSFASRVEPLKETVQ